MTRATRSAFRTETSKTLLRWIGGLQVASQKPVDFSPRFLRRLRIQPVEVVAARGVVVDLPLELLPFRLQRLDQPLDFHRLHVLIVGVAVDEQWRLQFLDVRYRRSLPILRSVFTDRLADVIR